MACKAFRLIKLLKAPVASAVPSGISFARLLWTHTQLS